MQEFALDRRAATPPIYFPHHRPQVEARTWKNQSQGGSPSIIQKVLLEVFGKQQYSPLDLSSMTVEIYKKISIMNRDNKIECLRSAHVGNLPMLRFFRDHQVKKIACQILCYKNGSKDCIGKGGKKSVSRSKTLLFDVHEPFSLPIEHRKSTMQRTLSSKKTKDVEKGQILAQETLCPVLGHPDFRVAGLLKGIHIHSGKRALKLEGEDLEFGPDLYKAICEGILDPSCPGGRYYLNLEDRLRIFHDVLITVSYAHSCGLTHRDIKATNILLKKDEIGRYRAHLNDWDLCELFGGSYDGNGNKLEGEYVFFDHLSKEGISTPFTDRYQLGLLLAYLVFGNDFEKFLGDEFVYDLAQRQKLLKQKILTKNFHSLLDQDTYLASLQSRFSQLGIDPRIILCIPRENPHRWTDMLRSIILHHLYNSPLNLNKTYVLNRILDELILRKKAHRLIYDLCMDNQNVKNFPWKYCLLSQSPRDRDIGLKKLEDFHPTYRNFMDNAAAITNDFLGNS
jgi:hypothetical protein